MLDRREEIELMWEFLDGTCHSIPVACEATGLPEYDDWEDRLLDINVEACSCCGWWHESCMLNYHESTGKSFCDQCNEPEDDGEDY